MTKGRPDYPKPPGHLDRPQGQVARLLRQTLQDSDFDTQRSLALAISYAQNTVSQYFNGSRLQNLVFIEATCAACIPGQSDRRAAQVENIMKVLRPALPDTARLLGQTYQGSRFITIADLASSTGLDPSDIERWLAGEAEPTPTEVDVFVRACIPDSAAADARVVEIAKLQQPGPQQSGSRWGRRGWWLAVTAVLVLLVLLGGGYAAYTARGSDPGPCGGDAAPSGGQCIGISDGSVNLAGDPSFATVLGKIKAENDRILAPGQGPVVSVAYAVPFPAAHAPLTDQTLRGLEGAYQMQLQRNEAGGFNPLGGPPRVQLLVANLGPDAAQPDQVSAVVNRLRERTAPTSAAPLVAVIGLDVSRPGIADTVTQLGQVGIPMVSGRLAGDDFAANAADKGFFAAAPPVRDQVTAAARYLSGRTRNLLLVQDTNRGDLYGRNVAGQFQTQFAAVSGGTPLPPPVSFDASLPGVQTAFSSNVLPAVCQLQPDVVFYAGRGANLPDFIRALGTRACLQIPVTVVSLSDGRDLANAIRAENANPAVEPQLANAMTVSTGRPGVNVVVVAESHPGIWADQQLVPDASHAVLSGSFATAFPQQFPDQRQVDQGGDVIMGHDAMQVIVEAIVRSRPPQSTDPVTTGLLRQALSGINTYSPVYGASGPIAYTSATPGSSAAGFPVNKNIPITRITRDGQITVLSARTP